MKIAAALQGVTRLFLDTAPVIYYVERNPTYTARVDDIFDRIDAGTPQAVTSPITLAECLVEPIRQGLAQAQQDFTDLIVSGANVTFLILDDRTAIRAADLRARYNLHLADALQVAAARPHPWEQLAGVMRKLRQARWPAAQEVQGQVVAPTASLP